MKTENNMILQTTAVKSVKVTGGGIAVGGSSYVATDKIIQATDNLTLIAHTQEIATLVATVFTAMYFFVMFLKASFELYDNRKAAKKNNGN